MQVDKEKLAKERGYRLDIAIRISKNNIDSFAKRYDLSRSSLFTWRSGKLLLNEKGAQRIIEALDRAGYYCDINWLLEGEGTYPIKKDAIKSELEPLVNKIIDVPGGINLLTETEKILTEIKTFEKLHPLALVTSVIDNAMEPFYKESDYVGGIALNKDEYQKAVNKNCIVVLRDSEPMVRHISKGQKAGTYNLSSLNMSSEADNLFLQNVFPDDLYPIVWHRRPKA